MKKTCLLILLSSVYVFVFSFVNAQAGKNRKSTDEILETTDNIQISPRTFLSKGQNDSREQEAVINNKDLLMRLNLEKGQKADFSSVEVKGHAKKKIKKDLPRLRNLKKLYSQHKKRSTGEDQCDGEEEVVLHFSSLYSLVEDGTECPCYCFDSEKIKEDSGIITKVTITSPDGEKIEKEIFIYHDLEIDSRSVYIDDGKELQVKNRIDEAGQVVILNLGMTSKEFAHSIEEISDGLEDMHQSIESMIDRIPSSQCTRCMQYRGARHAICSSDSKRLLVDVESKNTSELLNVNDLIKSGSHIKLTPTEIELCQKLDLSPQNLLTNIALLRTRTIQLTKDLQKAQEGFLHLGKELVKFSKRAEQLDSRDAGDSSIQKSGRIRSHKKKQSVKLGAES